MSGIGTSPLAGTLAQLARVSATARARQAAAPAPPSTSAQPSPAPSQPTSPNASRRLEANPLFANGSPYDELQLSPANLDFARTHFGLEQAFVDLVRLAPENTRFSVVYHSDARGVQVDAYRAVAAAGRKAAFSAYRVLNPGFDPNRAYKNERATAMGQDRWFGTLLVSRQLAVPDNADAALRQFLSSSGYEHKETVPFASFGYPQPFNDYFAIGPQLNVEMHELHEKSFGEKAKLFFQLCGESPDYRALKIADVLDEVGSAMVLGVITPKLWEQGTKYGVAATMSSIANIGSPFVGIVGESFLGSVVDNAVNSDRPMDGLRKIALWTGTLKAAKVATTFAMHPAILATLGNSPGVAFLGLYGTTALLGSVAGVVAGKAELAIKDQIINKGLRSTTDYSKNFYQILGVESSISRALYLGSYAATVGALAAFPGASVAIAGAGAALWAGSNFIFPLYKEKPEVSATIEGTSFIHQGNRYVFDSGWEVEFSGQEGRIVQDAPGRFSVAFQEGELYVRNGTAPKLEHSRRVADYVPGLKSMKFLGEKERWTLDDGSDAVTVSRYGNNGYRVDKVSDHEYVLTKNAQVDPFWTKP